MQSSPRLAISLVMAMLLPSVSVPNVSALMPRERQFEFDYKATVKDIPVGTKKVDVWIPVPHDSSFQKITDLQIDSPYPYEIHTAQYGNEILHLSLDNPQQSSLTVSMRFH